ncbi:SIR2-domain-containing protein [Microthyrium microscopicum]|uniref:SIR2-domain-containing protein n=1 Tax=Microthyrium microscopicum TaxID=703497 RepID=A0A6A6U656_9PEZI|nr:SIR2-domain-containing protein [Microthyrium microscopicum]
MTDSVPNTEDTQKEEEAASPGSDFSNESLYEELLGMGTGAEEGTDFAFAAGSDPNVCTADEALHLRRRLRDVGAEEWIAETYGSGKYTAIKLLSVFKVARPDFITDEEHCLELLGICMYREMNRRHRLDAYSTIEDVVELLLTRKNILVITGAGISTSLGIPDFRSKHTGFWSKLHEQGFTDPESLFTLEEFDANPQAFYNLAAELLPPSKKWTPTHQFIRTLQDQGKLLRNYTQNIDGVEETAGILPSKTLHCHGSWNTASCRKCRATVPGSTIFPYLERREIAYCQSCPLPAPGGAPGMKRKRSSNSTHKSRKDHSFDDSDSDVDDDIPSPGVMKPDITFFGESLPDTFYDNLNTHDRAAVDLVIVLGTSMTVAPVADIPAHLPRDVPHVYVSREACKHIEFDVSLLGECDTVVQELCRRVGWKLGEGMDGSRADGGGESVRKGAGEGEWWVGTVKGEEEVLKKQKVLGEVKAEDGVLA